MPWEDFILGAMLATTYETIEGINIMFRLKLKGRLHNTINNSLKRWFSY